MFSDFFIKRPRFAFVISIIVVLAGVIALKHLPIAAYPEITPPEVSVSATYFGADAETVVKTVAMPIEEEVNGVENMLYMNSTSSNSSYDLSVTFETGTDPDIAQVKVQNRVQKATSKLPQSVKQTGVSVTRKTSNNLCFIAFSSPDNSYTEQAITDYVFNNVKNVLAKINGIGEARVYGSKSSMRIWLDVNKMTSLKISPSEVNSAIQSQNYQPSLGSIGSMPTEGNQPLLYTLNTVGRINTVEEFENIIIRTASEGGLVKLKDIARVEIGQEDYSVVNNLNGKPAVAISLSLSSGANALDTMKKVNEELATISKTMPEGIEYKIPFDSTKFINASVREVVITLITTLLLVIIVCYIFLQNIYSTLIPSITIPVSILGTLSFLYLLGYSINMFTLFALLLAVGLVVDDAICVVERVLYLIKIEKLPAIEASFKTMQEISGALIATTLVLVAIFLPVSFMGGITGEIYRQFSITIIVAVSLSTFNALTLSPALCSLLLRNVKETNLTFFKTFNNILEKSNRVYSVFVRFFSNKMGIVFIVLVALFAYAIHLFRTSSTSFIPSEDQGSIIVNVELPEGATMSRTRELYKKINTVLDKEKSIDFYLNIMGFSMISGASGENSSMTFITLKDWAERQEKSEYSTNILNRLQFALSDFPEAKIQLFEQPAIPGLGTVAGFEAKLRSKNNMDYQKLEAVLQSFLSKLNREPEIAYAYSSYNASTPTIFLDIDRTKAELMNVSMGNIFNTLEGYLGSSYINDVNFGTQVNKVMMQSDWNYRRNIDDINDLYVPNKSGIMVPMRGIVDFKKILAPRIINRYNQFPSAGVNGVPANNSSSGSVVSRIEELAKGLPSGYDIEWSGMSYQEKNTEGQIVFLLLIAIVFVYLFLVAQYESFIIPISVLLSLVVAMIGALVGLRISGISMSIYSQLGLILLLGLAAKNAILIVEFAEDEKRKGSSSIKAALTGLKERFRAILMTASSSILGFYPLIVATGAASNSRIALGVPVFYGMLAGTVFGLFVIPLVYLLVDTIVAKFNRKN